MNNVIDNKRNNIGDRMQSCGAPILFQILLKFHLDVVEITLIIVVSFLGMPPSAWSIPDTLSIDTVETFPKLMKSGGSEELNTDSNSFGGPSLFPLKTLSKWILIRAWISLAIVFIAAR